MLLNHSVENLSGMKGNYTIDGREQSCIQLIKQTAGNAKVLVLVSGGVDSTVLVGLCYKALDASQVKLVFVSDAINSAWVILV